MIDTHAIARQLTGAGLTTQRADAITDAVRQAAVRQAAVRQAAERGDHATRTELESLATKVVLPTWRLA